MHIFQMPSVLLQCASFHPIKQNRKYKHSDFEMQTKIFKTKHLHHFIEYISCLANSYLNFFCIPIIFINNKIVPKYLCFSIFCIGCSLIHKLSCCCCDFVVIINLVFLTFNVRPRSSLISTT